MVLYILKFKEHNLVKIGISSHLVDRVLFLQKDLNIEFDFYNSVIITADSNARIRVLEKQLLQDLKAFEVKQDHPFKIPNGAKTKYTEIRSDCAVNTLLDILKLKIMKLKLPLNIHTGLDISGIQSDVIPSEIISPYEIDSNAIFSVINLHAKKHNLCPNTILFEVLYLWAIEQGYKFENKHKKRSKSCYYA